MKNSADDLGPLARRRELDDAEERRLRILLTSSLEARLVHQAGSEFDELDSVLPGDEQRAATIAENVLTELKRGAAQRKRLQARPWLLPAVALLVASGVAAGTAAVRRGSWNISLPLERPPQANASAPATPPRSRPEHVAVASRPEASKPLAVEPIRETARPNTRGSASPELIRSPTSSSPADAAAGRGRSTIEGAVQPTVAALFAQAGLARRQGRTTEAIAGYEALNRMYPGSREAQAARLAAGMLELGLGESQAALGQFDAYLSRAPASDLRAEAWWGKAQALLQLGHEDTARTVMTQLVSSYPESPYAAAARSRLQSMKRPAQQ